MQLDLDLLALSKHTICRIQQSIHIVFPAQFRDILIYAFELEWLAFSTQVNNTHF